MCVNVLEKTKKEVGRGRKRAEWTREKRGRKNGGGRGMRIEKGETNRSWKGTKEGL